VRRIVAARGVAAVALSVAGVTAGASLSPGAATPSAKHVSAGSTGLLTVCGARFRALPSGWHQSGSPSALVIGGQVPSNTDSWAATPRSVFDLVRPLPRKGIYIWVDLIRPRSGVRGVPLRLPLQLHNASVIAQEGRFSLPEYRFQGRYRHQYQVILGVDFGRASPPTRLRRLADRVLHQLVLPRWVPFRHHGSC
jgi:hypothetical protein